MISLSFVLIFSGIGTTIAKGGFNLGIDFEAGLTQRLVIDKDDVNIEELRSALSGFEGLQVQTMGGVNEFQIRVKDTGEENFQEMAKAKIGEELSSVFGASSITIRGSEYVGPRFSQGLTTNTVWLIVLTLSIILIYIWFRFKLAYAVSAVVATLHDLIIMIGFIGATGMEVSTATIAAILTIIGYSLNDTIVVFDRIRENRSIMKDSDLPTIVNTSITQSLSRTIITSLTTLIAVLAIYFFTSGDIQNFALALVIGIVVGTYSSIFIASPVFMGLTKLIGEKNVEKS